jgi:hypothetical protein
MNNREGRVAHWGIRHSLLNDSINGSICDWASCVDLLRDNILGLDEQADREDLICPSIEFLFDNRPDQDYAARPRVRVHC